MLYDHVATYSEAAVEFATNYGMDHPQEAWVLSPWDSWHANPFYAGPKVPHPEADYDFEPLPVPAGGLTVLLDDEIPF